MIGLVIVTHGRLAVEFRAALEHVVRAAVPDRVGDYRTGRQRRAVPQGHRSRRSSASTAAMASPS